MDVTITTIYCLCDDFMKAMNHRPDDPQARLSTADVTSTIATLVVRAEPDRLNGDGLRVCRQQRAGSLIFVGRRHRRR